MLDHREPRTGHPAADEPAERLSSAGEQPPPVPPAAAPEIRSLLRFLVAVIVVAVLYIAQDMLIPMTLAVMLSFVLSPLVNAIRRTGLARAPAVALSMLLALGAITVVGTLLGGQAALLASDVPGYVQTIERKLQGVQAIVTARVASITEQFGPPLFVEAPARAPASAAPATGAAGARAPSGTLVNSPSPGRVAPAPPPRNNAAALARAAQQQQQQQQQPVLVQLATPETSPLDVARAIVAPVLGPLETTLVVFIVAIFILMQQEDLRNRFIRLFGSSDLHRTTMAMDDVGTRLSRYFVSQLAVNASFGLVIGLGLWLIGIPSPALWGVVCGLLRFVPYVGALLGAVAPLALAAAIDPGWSMAAYTALLFLIVEPFTGYVVEPLLYGHSTGLSPVAVIVAALFWTWLWGPIGLILSTPLTLCLVVMGRYVHSLEFLDVLLGDRPALSPADAFYQRMLADDPDETLDQAEQLLANRSLLDYYDGVMLPALQLAAADYTRGSLTRERTLELTRSMLEVIDDLNTHVDRRGSDSLETPIATHASSSDAIAVACVAGRGAFDDTVAAMLEQLLRKRGVASLHVPHAAVSRDMIGELNLSGVRVIALSYLEPRVAPAHLRQLVRRLRTRAPEAVVIVGLWAAEDAVLADQALRQELGADYCAGSLHQAVDVMFTTLDAPPAAPHSAPPVDRRSTRETLEPHAS